jgi:hypothetical protein
MYSGPNCPDRPFYAELDDMEINNWIRGVFAYGDNQNFGSSTVPLREGVESSWMSLLKLTFCLLVSISIFSTCTPSHVGSWVHA